MLLSRCWIFLFLMCWFKPPVIHIFLQVTATAGCFVIYVIKNLCNNGLYFTCFQEKSHTCADIPTVSGSLHALMNWHATCANTRAKNPSDAKSATEASDAVTILHCTTNDTNPKPQNTPIARRKVIEVKVCETSLDKL